MPQSEEQSQPPSPGVSVALGALIILFAKFFSMAGGYVILLVIGNRLQENAQYGDYETVRRLLNILTMVMITGTIQAVSKFISEDPQRQNEVKFKAMKIQFILGGGLALTFALASPFISMWQKGDLWQYLLIGSVIIFCYSLYGVFIGTVNGLKKFHIQGLFDICYTILRATLMIGPILILGKAAPQYQIHGIYAGFALASLLILLAAWKVVGFQKDSSTSISSAKIFAFMLPVMAFTFLTNFFQSMDVLILRSLESDEKRAAITAGIYGKSQLIAMIPNLILVALAFVIFPLISRITHIGDKEKTRQYVRESVRVSLLIALFSATVISVQSGDMIQTLFGANALDGSDALSVLVFAFAFYAIGTVGTTIISGGGQPGMSLVLVLVSVTAGVGLNYWFAGHWGMIGAAWAMAVSMLMLASLAGLYILRKYGAFFSWLSLTRIILACAVVWLAARYIIPHPFADGATGLKPKLFVVAKSGALGFVFLISLVILREVKKDEVGKIKSFMKMKA